VCAGEQHNGVAQLGVAGKRAEVVGEGSLRLPPEILIYSLKCHVVFSWS
jgi:hypothetical protein